MQFDTSQKEASWGGGGHFYLRSFEVIWSKVGLIGAKWFFYFFQFSKPWISNRLQIRVSKISMNSVKLNLFAWKMSSIKGDIYSYSFESIFATKNKIRYYFWALELKKNKLFHTAENFQLASEICSWYTWITFYWTKNGFTQYINIKLVLVWTP